MHKEVTWNKTFILPGTLFLRWCWISCRTYMHIPLYNMWLYYRQNNPWLFTCRFFSLWWHFKRKSSHLFLFFEHNTVHQQQEYNTSSTITSNQNQSHLPAFEKIPFSSFLFTYICGDWRDVVYKAYLWNISW